MSLKQSSLPLLHLFALFCCVIAYLCLEAILQILYTETYFQFVCLECTYTAPSSVWSSGTAAEPAFSHRAHWDAWGLCPQFSHMCVSHMLATYLPKHTHRTMRTSARMGALWQSPHPHVQWVCMESMPVNTQCPCVAEHLAQRNIVYWGWKGNMSLLAHPATQMKR